jgi:hypothetical protein
MSEQDKFNASAGSFLDVLRHEEDVVQKVLLAGIDHACKKMQEGLFNKAPGTAEDFIYRYNKIFSADLTGMNLLKQVQNFAYKNVIVGDDGREEFISRPVQERDYTSVSAFREEGRDIVLAFLVYSLFREEDNIEPPPHSVALQYAANLYALQLLNYALSDENIEDLIGGDIDKISTYEGMRDAIVDINTVLRDSFNVDPVLDIIKKQYDAGHDLGQIYARLKDISTNDLTVGFLQYQFDVSAQSSAAKTKPHMPKKPSAK